MSERPYWEGKEYSFVCHKTCEYFPCHKTKDPDNFNCLFCYCPLYALGDACGGNFRFTEKGVKDCTNCLLPHVRKNYGYVTGKYSEIMEVAGKNRKENRELIQNADRGKSHGGLRREPEGAFGKNPEADQRAPARERSRKIKRNGE